MIQKKMNIGIAATAEEEERFFLHKKMIFYNHQKGQEKILRHYNTKGDATRTRQARLDTIIRAEARI